MTDSMRIIDGHVHTFSSDRIAEKVRKSFNKLFQIEFENLGTGTVENLLEEMAKSRTDCSILANFASPGILDANNRWTLDMAQEHEGLIPLVSFHPDMEQKIPEAFEDYLKLGAKGVKFHNMSQGFAPFHKAIQPIYERCNDMAFPIEFHCGKVSNCRLNDLSDTEKIIPVLEKYPNIPVILTHMANGEIESVIRLAGDYPNVFFDTSIVITGHPGILEVNESSWQDDQTVVGVINRVGADRMLFGSDYPWGSPRHDIQRINSLNITTGQKELIFGKNAQRIFKI